MRVAYFLWSACIYYLMSNYSIHPRMLMFPFFFLAKSFSLKGSWEFRLSLCSKTKTLLVSTVKD